MTRNELKELVKQVVAEETEYQKLFKTMLDRSGKDINSMNDEEKKKFFTAVDKAYKAKSEGKLIDSKKKESINEDTSVFTSPVLIYALMPFVSYGISWAYARLNLFLMKKEYKEGMKYVLEKLENNQEFINAAAEIMKQDGGSTSRLTVEKITDLPVVRKLAEKSAAIIRKKYDTWAVAPEGLQIALTDIFIKAWKDNSVKQKWVNDIKNKLK